MEKKAVIIAVAAVAVIAVAAAGAYLVLSDDEGEGTTVYHYTISDVYRDSNGNVWMKCTFEEPVYSGMVLSVVCDGYQLYERTIGGSESGFYSPGIMLESTYGMTLSHIRESAQVLLEGYETLRIA